MNLLTESKNARKLHLQRKFTYNKIKEYHKRFLDKKTNIFSKKYTSLRNCPVCNHNGYISIFNKSGGIYVKCGRCSMVFLNPVFKESSLKEYYKNLNTDQAKIISKESKFYREVYSLGLKKIMEYIKSGRIMDIGCCNGFFLDIAREKGWDTTGVELCLSDAEIARKGGHIIFTEPLETIKFDIKFDAVTLWDVFEHIPNPQKYLLSLSKILDNNGVIFMQIPNSDALAARIMRERCNMFDGVEHVNLYNPKTIKKVLRDSGFKILHLSTIISEMYVINNYLHYENPYFGSIKKTANLSYMLNEKLIHKNLLGYKMQIVAKKHV